MEQKRSAQTEVTCLFLTIADNTEEQGQTASEGI